MSKIFSTWFRDKLVSKGNNLDRLYTQNLNYRDDVISQGLAFYIDYHQSALTNGTKSYAQVTTPSDKYVILVDRELTTDKERLFFRTYETYSAVTESTDITVKNLRLDSPFSTGTTIKVCTTPTTITQSSILTNLPIFGAVGNGNRSSGGIKANELFRVYPPNTKLLLEWENASADPVYVATMMAWFEIPESAIIN